MEINILQIIVIVILGSLCYWANEMLNKVPVLKTVVSVVIVVICVLALLSSLGIGGGHISIR